MSGWSSPPCARVKIHCLTKCKTKSGKLCFRENKHKADIPQITTNKMLKVAKSNFLFSIFMLSWATCTDTGRETQIAHILNSNLYLS